MPARRGTPPIGLLRPRPHSAPAAANQPVENPREAQGRHPIVMEPKSFCCFARLRNPASEGIGPRASSDSLQSLPAGSRVPTVQVAFAFYRWPILFRARPSSLGRRPQPPRGRRHFSEAGEHGPRPGMIVILSEPTAVSRPYGQEISWLGVKENASQWDDTEVSNRRASDGGPASIRRNEFALPVSFIEGRKKR
jgi:hypothetical protein